MQNFSHSLTSRLIQKFRDSVYSDFLLDEKVILIEAFGLLSFEMQSTEKYVRFLLEVVLSEDSEIYSIAYTTHCFFQAFKRFLCWR